ncbi:MAG: winged helix-turn-helix domain-containing protein [Prochloron sp. SP5CPC1]|nr:winged helix-turn-helix domain-containing protein [Candidatus Paraprochloron terpiosi SP5CPC1]
MNDEQRKILQAIDQGSKSTHAIAEKTGLKKHLVNYYLEEFEKDGYFIAHRESQSGERNFDCLILKDKGKVAIENPDDLLEPTSTSKYDLRGAQIGGFAETVNGNQISTQHNYAPEQKQTLVEAAKEIQQLLEQQQHEGSDLETAQKQVAEDLATKAKANVTILEKREISELGKIFV